MRNELIIDEFYLLRVGSFKNNHCGDLYENLYKNQWLAVACCCEDDDEIILIEGFHLPLKINFEQSFWDLVPNVAKLIKTKIKQNILVGLLRSAFDRDADGLIDAGVDISRISIFPENQIFDYSKVSDYSIVSKTIFTDKVIYNKNENIVQMPNGLKYKLGDLFGRFDEDENWVVCIG